MISRTQFIQDAIASQNIPYQHQGRSKFGADCIGYVALIFEKQGYTPEYPKAYKRVSHIDAIRVYFNGHFLPTDEFLGGNLIIFKKRKVFTHVGILLNEGMMIHCTNNYGSHAGGVKITSFKEEPDWLNQDYIIYNLESVR